MKYLKNRNVIIGASLLVLTVFVLRDSFREYGTSIRWQEFLNVHESSDTWVRFGGKKFHNVQGSAPCYLDIPKSNMVFFVTADEKHYTHWVYHFVDRRAGQSIDIPAPNLYLGSGIGTPDDANDHDWLVEEAGNHVVIAHRFEKRVTYYEFDLAKRTVSLR